MSDAAHETAEGTASTAQAAEISFGKVTSKRRRKGVKRKRVDDEPEGSTASISDVLAEQKARQRKLGVDAEGATAEKHSATAQALAEAAATEKKASTHKEPVISQSLAAQMEERAAKMEGLLSTGGGFRVEARNRLDLDADNNPVMMQYVQARLAAMKGDTQPANSPDKPPAEADEAYALPPAAAAALAEARAAKAQQDTASTPLMMNIGLAEVELPDSYKARNEQDTKRAMQMQQMADASAVVSTQSGGGSLTANYSEQASEYASRSRAGLHAGDGMAADDAMVHLHAGKAGKPSK